MATKAKGSGVLRSAMDFALHLLTRTDTTIAEFQNSTMLIFVGVTLIGGQLAVWGPFRDAMLTIMAVERWGALFAVLGIVQSAANLRRNRTWRRSGALASVLLCGFVGSLGYIQVSPAPLVSAMFVVQAVVQGIVYLRLGVGGGR